MQLIFNSIDIFKVEAEVYILPGSLLFQDGWVGGVEELRIKPSQLSTKLKLKLKLSLAIVKLLAIHLKPFKISYQNVHSAINENHTVYSS